MKLTPFFLWMILGPLVCRAADEAEPARVVLDPIAVENLRIQTEPVEPADFEETIFALGRIAVYPGNRAVVSSRIAGRALQVQVKPDHPIEKGAPAVVVESRQVADPPPTVTLTAPMSGLISTVNIAPGEPVSPDAGLAEILDLTDVYALAQVPEQVAGRLQRGQMARIRVPAVAQSSFEAKLEHLGVVADAATGTVEAAFHVHNPQLTLRPGMRAEFSIIVSRRSDVLSVPRRALQGAPANRFVYVRDHELPHAFLKTPVVTGQSNGDRVEITRGLSAGAEVVVDGAYSLAFAGEGSMSLKEALDAAHGHEHNPDGSEIDGPAHHEHDEHEHDDHGHDDHGHEHEDEAHGSHDYPETGEHAHHDWFWKLLSGVLFVALLVIGFRRPSREPQSEQEPSSH